MHKLFPHLNPKNLMFNTCNIRILFFVIALSCLITTPSLCEFSIVRNKIPDCVICIPESASEQERFAANEINYFIEKASETRLQIKLDTETIRDENIILLGTFDNNRYISELYNRGLISRRKDLSEEEYIVKLLSKDNQNFIAVVGNQGREVIYGAYELIEKTLEAMTGLIPVDLDFYITPVSSLSLKAMDVRSAPFYPDRCTLSQEDPDWMSRHRLNISGAEGVWSGTGIDDGIGTAFKYVTDPQFDDFQDDPYTDRWKKIMNIRRRLIDLNQRSIDPYLFMYVMGEPTKAMMKNHPELLGGPVAYRESRNRQFYSPISWTKPESRNLIKDLVKSIVKTYSPWLKGFHLRSWGWETRAPAGNDAQQQQLLWELYYDIINAALEVNPDFRFIISGYESHWLRDPDRKYIEKLPKGTIILVKWGIDGEPTDDPQIDSKLINSPDINGHSVMVLSHSVEEAMPLWMLEADLFVRGVRKYAGNPDIKGLCGFALQGEIGLSHLDKIVSSRINWNPDEDYVALMKNYLISCYGMAAQQTLAALRANSSVLSEFFSDYAGLTSLTGGYGNGSRGYATRLWNIIGKEAVRDILSMPEEKMVEYSKERLSSLIPMQQESSNEMQAAIKTAKYPSDKLKADHFDALHIMRMWVRFFESRLRLIEALEVGFNERGIDQISQKINSAIEYSKEMQMEISEITHFVKVFDYDDNGARNSLIKSIDEEIDFLKNFDPERILASLANDIGHGSPEFDIITNLVCPNPINRMGFFCYELSLSADEVNISIYSVNGRLIRKISRASANRGYNEELWDTRDENGMALSSGTYLYKITANRDNKKIQKIGKLSILR